MKLSHSYHKPVNPTSLMEVVDGTAAAIKKWIAETGTKVSHIVCTGSSGQSVAWPVSYKLGIPVCVVRKLGENSHAGLITGHGDLRSYVVIDDFVCSGETLDRVFATIADAAGSAEHAPKCAAIFLYDSPNGPSPWRYTGIPVIANRFVAD